MFKRTLIALASTTALVGAAQADMFDFNTYDGDRDGFVTQTEYRDGLVRDGYYTRLDANRDGRLDTNEFADTEFYASYDGDADGFLTEDEYYDGLYASYDRDADGRLSDGEFGEFRTAGNTFLDGVGDVVTGTVNAGASVVEGTVGGTLDLLGFDNDSDRMLNDAEFRTALTENGYFDRFDRNNDGFLAENEISDDTQIYLSEYDADADGRLSSDEYYGAIYASYDANRDGLLDENEYGRFQTERM